jgi:hypothetical protein
MCYLEGLLYWSAGSCRDLAIKCDLWGKCPHAPSIGSQYTQYTLLTITNKVIILRRKVISTISYIHESKIRHLKKVMGLGEHL